jgi:uncharacterized SAM-binding protein YcdF (DUF218 family)
VVLLSWRPTRRFGHVWLILLAVGYWLLSSMPFVSLLAARLTSAYQPITSVSQVQDATAVVVLGGGNTIIRGRAARLDLPSEDTANRVLEGARIYRLMGNPWVIPSGGISSHRGGPPEADAMRDLLLRLGVPPDRILLEDRSRDTHQEAVLIPPILAAHQIHQFVLVTSPIHMRRAMGAFRATGMHPVPAISTSLYGSDESWNMAPSGEGIQFGAAVMHEYVGWLYYWVRGWLVP